MTKKDIVRLISDSMNLTQLDVKAIVQKTFDIIVDTLATEGRIELRNFGVFEVKERAPRKARNPRTGEQVMVPARRVVTFRPGKDMEERIAAARPEPKGVTPDKRIDAPRSAPTETVISSLSPSPQTPPPQEERPPQTGPTPPEGFSPGSDV